MNPKVNSLPSYLQTYCLLLFYIQLMELSEDNAKQKLVTYLPSILMKKKNENSFTVEFSLNNKKISNPQTHRERLVGGGGGGASK